LCCVGGGSTGGGGGVSCGGDDDDDEDYDGKSGYGTGDVLFVDVMQSHKPTF